MKALFLFAAILSMCISCSTFVPIEKVLPPEVALPKDQKLVFVSQFYADSLPFKNDNKLEVFKMGHENFIKGLKTGFDTSKYYHLTISDTIMGKEAHTNPGREFDKLLASQLCNSNNANYLIVLDAFDLSFDQDVEVIEEEDGTKNRTAYYDLVVETYITLFDHRGVEVDRIHDELRIEHNKRKVISGLLAVGPSMGKADKNVLLISDELGRNFIRKFYPSVTLDLREFYNTKEFKNSYEAYISSDWPRVEEELLKYSESENKEISGRAAHNMAVLCENLQRYDEMNYWYAKASQDLGKKAPKRYNVLDLLSD